MSIVEGIVMIAMLLSSVAFLVVMLGAVLFIAVLGFLALSSPVDSENLE